MASIHRLLSTVLPALLILAASHTPVYAALGKELPSVIKPEFTEPRKVVELFFQAVELRQLVIFGQVIQRSMLVPLRVEYVYEIDNPVPSIMVYAELVQPLPVPEQKDCQVRAVSVTLDEQGNIIESKAHIWVK